VNSKQRLIAYVARQKTDRGVFWPESPWPETRARWLHEGMAADHNFGFDFDDGLSRTCLGVNIGFMPPFEEEVLADEGETLLVRDVYGIIKRQQKSGSGMPQFVEFPVSNRASWQAIQPRLDPQAAGRFPGDWDDRVAQLRRAEWPISSVRSHLDGFFGYLRELCGDGIYYLLYDDPDLVHEMLAFQVYRMTTFLRSISRDVQIDRQYIWEDMCYRNGPLISPEMFRRFLLRPYQQVVAVARECHIPIMDVDSDGDVSDLVPLWIEAGVDMLHPFEVAAGMDVVALTRQYGDKIIMRGGIDKRELTRDRAAIDREIERVRPAFETACYIPTVDHTVPPDVSWANYQYYHEQRARLVGAA
jgi:uroporphyrinogen decarboxylase